MSLAPSVRAALVTLALFLAAGPVVAAVPPTDGRSPVAGVVSSVAIGALSPLAGGLQVGHAWTDDDADGDGSPDTQADGYPDADTDGDGVPDSVVLAADTELAEVGVRTLIPAGRLTKRPFRGIILVSVGNSVVCTGFVVAPRKVVTAAHCLTRDAAAGNYRFRDGLPHNIRLYRAYSLAAGGSPYDVCDVVRAWAHPRFIRRVADDERYGSNAHDYAVLTTEAGCSYPRNAIMRMWATTEAGSELRAGRTLKLGGYPADPRFDDMNGLNLWRTRGTAQPNGGDERILFTSGFVAQGMSGGPVWRTFSKDSPCGHDQCVVGVLTECAVSPSGLCRLGDSSRRAVRITPGVKRTIAKR